MKTRMDVKKDCVVCSQGKKKGGEENSQKGLHGVQGSSVSGEAHAFHQGKKTVGTFSIPGNFRTLSDLITASLAKC